MDTMFRILWILSKEHKVVVVTHYYFMSSVKLKIIRTFILKQAVLYFGDFIQHPETAFGLK